MVILSGGLLGEATIPGRVWLLFVVAIAPLQRGFLERHFFEAPPIQRLFQHGSHIESIAATSARGLPKANRVVRYERLASDWTIPSPGFVGPSRHEVDFARHTAEPSSNGHPIQRETL